MRVREKVLICDPYNYSTLINKLQVIALDMENHQNGKDLPILAIVALFSSKRKIWRHKLFLYNEDSVRENPKI